LLRPGSCGGGGRPRPIRWGRRCGGWGDHGSGVFRHLGGEELEWPGRCSPCSLRRDPATDFVPSCSRGPCRRRLTRRVRKPRLFETLRRRRPVNALAGYRLQNFVVMHSEPAEQGRTFFVPPQAREHSLQVIASSLHPPVSKKILAAPWRPSRLRLADVTLAPRERHSCASRTPQHRLASVSAASRAKSVSSYTIAPAVPAYRPPDGAILGADCGSPRLRYKTTRQRPMFGA
jgi:hypothetical protein